MKSHKKEVVPEKNSIQYVRHLLNAEKKENKRLLALIEGLEFEVDSLKKQNDQLSDALAGKISDEALKNMALKVLRRKERKLQEKEDKKKKSITGETCPVCDEAMLEMKKFDGTSLFKCMNCRKKK